MSLTPKQRRLRKEIEDVAAIIDLDHWNILNYAPDTRTVFLELMKNKLIRGHVIVKYALVDEFLSTIICNFYFRRPKRSKTSRPLWRTKRFKVFNHYLMDETFLPKKLTLVDAIRKVPKPVVSAIHRINDVRNALAHGFFPENRRRYMTQKKVIYEGVDIFTKDGVEKFEQDFELAQDYLFRRAFPG